MQPNGTTNSRTDASVGSRDASLRRHLFYLALLNTRDVAHKAAHHWQQASNIREIVTTSWVLLELADAMHLPHERVVAIRFVTLLRTAVKTRIMPASEELLERGFALYANRRDKAWSLTDCLSFVVMADERLTEALTGDHHFVQAGYHALMR